MDIIAKYNEVPCNMCNGTWTLIVDGEDVSNKIPEDIRTGSMHTENQYSYFQGDDEESLEFHRGGLTETDWILKNKSWLDSISKEPSIQLEIFREIQRNEFTGCGTCGGCI